MNLKLAHNRLKALKLGIFAVAIAFTTLSAHAQEEHKNPNVRLGQKALESGDFKTAIVQLEKSLPAEANDPHVLYLLGYSQFQVGNFKKTAETFEKVIALDAKNSSAYYYRAKANNALAVSETEKFSDSQREQLLQLAIGDYTKALGITPNDAKLYQNRGVAYRDLGVLKGTHGTAGYNKTIAKDAYDKAIIDLKKALSYDAARKDLQTEVKKATVYRDNLK